MTALSGITLILADRNGHLLVDQSRLKNSLTRQLIKNGFKDNVLCVAEAQPTFASPRMQEAARRQAADPAVAWSPPAVGNPPQADPWGEATPMDFSPTGPTTPKTENSPEAHKYAHICTSLSINLHECFNYLRQFISLSSTLHFARGKLQLFVSNCEEQSVNHCTLQRGSILLWLHTPGESIQSCPIFCSPRSTCKRGSQA